MKDGGPAFPSPEVKHPGFARAAHEAGQGMSLRDWFAGQALVGVLANNHLLVTVDRNAGISVPTRTAAALFAYAVAEKMIEEKTRRENGGTTADLKKDA